MSIGGVVVRSLDTGEETELFPGAFPTYVSTGHLIYAVNDVLFAVSFDPVTLESGSPVSLVVGVRAGPAQYSVSGTGSLAYVPGGGVGGNTFAWVDRNGNEERLGPSNAADAEPLPPGQYGDPRFSPNGQQLTFQDANAGNDIWVYDLERGTQQRLTLEEGEDETPVWSPDGEWIAYASGRGDGFARTIFRKRVDGTGTEETLWATDDHAHVMSWTPDGESLLIEVAGITPESGNDILLLPIEGDAEPSPLIQTAANEGAPRLSPDGGWLAFVSDESGQEEVYLSPFPDLDREILVSTSGGTQPVWSRSGEELFYRGDGSVMVVDIEEGDTSVPSSPRRLFPDSYINPLSLTHVQFEIAPDGDRFVMISAGITEDSVSGAPRINVVQNWFQELLERVPVD